VRLQHSGVDRDGRLLATFEHWYTDARNVPLLIRQSTDGGRSWSTLATVYDPHGNNQMFQPFLFEFPTSIGHYPAGTLLLVANSIESHTQEKFLSWRSVDHGRTWIYIGCFQSGESSGSPSKGIWEPFLYRDSLGRIVCVFSDERQAPRRSQFIGEIVSTDGGTTWSAETDVVVGATATDRPGMPVVARMQDEAYILAAEVCGPTFNCLVHTVTSPDGWRWGGGIGIPAITRDGKGAFGSPYIVAAPKQGISGDGYLLLSSFHVKPMSQADSGAPEDQQEILVCSQRHVGQWTWMGAPYAPMKSNSNVRPNYSPELMLSSKGEQVSQISSTGGGIYGDQVTFGTIATALVPKPHSYHDSFSESSGAGWVEYGGAWNVSGNAYNEIADLVDGKALVGPVYLASSKSHSVDYSLKGEVLLRSKGKAGFLVRASCPAQGVNRLRGYYIALDAETNNLILGKESDSWIELKRVTVAEGVQPKSWYHILITLKGDRISVVAYLVGSRRVTRLRVTDQTYLWGGIGIEERDTPASWRNIWLH
jgi:hypothetical protein